MAIRPKHLDRASELGDSLATFAHEIRPLPGVQEVQCRNTFVRQIIESLRRIEYANVISVRIPSPDRADPRSPLFDPERAAVWHARNGNLEEAIWLLFLATACGKHAIDGWQLARDIYGKIGSNRDYWHWKAVSHDPSGFREWVDDNRDRLAGDGISRRFGNHRKYANVSQTGVAVESYVGWVTTFGSHKAMLRAALAPNPEDAQAAFDVLYKSMLKTVKHFGRLGCFDFLTMIGKLHLAPIEPGSTYMKGATGPFDGANLLFQGKAQAPLSARVLDGWLVELGSFLGIGMQALEDSLCNWQKSPNEFKHFKG